MFPIEPRTVTVLIKPKKVPDQMKGIFLPASVRNREQQAVTEGEVVAIGPDAWNDYKDTGAEVGDWVFYAQYAGFFVPDPDEKDRDGYVLVNDEDIKAVLKRRKD